MSANLTQPDGAGVADPFIHYIRSVHFVAPGLERRYWRLFGDLEYDLRSLRVESVVMEQRIVQVRGMMAVGEVITPEREQTIDAAARQAELPCYRRLEKFRSRIDRARGFSFDREREKQALTMLADIAGMVLGISDRATRQRHLAMLRSACEAYSALDLEALLDLHDRVQELPVGERRDACSQQEQQTWQQQLDLLYSRHPLRSAYVLDTPRSISGHILALRSRIEVAQGKLSQQILTYLSIVRATQQMN